MGIFHSITITDIISHWNIKRHMRYIMEFVTGIKVSLKMKGGKLILDFQKGNSSRPADSFRYPFVSCCSLSNASKK